MAVELYEHQQEAIDKLHNGNILCGGVGTGKSRTALAYYYTKVCGGTLTVEPSGFKKRMINPMDLYIITTARKRNTMEWDAECLPFHLFVGSENEEHVTTYVDSWNNISKYVNIKHAFFIFDEQRVVGYGSWASSFIKIAKNNQWILLSATPGDTWMDYMSVFIANGFYRNKTDFVRNHVVYNRYMNFNKIDHYVEIGRLQKLKDKIVVRMHYKPQTSMHFKNVKVSYDKELIDMTREDRWNFAENKPLKNISDLCAAIRKVTNSDHSRFIEVSKLCDKYERIIIFYNYDYELEILRSLSLSGKKVYEYNGHKHDMIPDSGPWVYLVQYTAGAEGWNCIKTNAMIFYSLNYSYKIMHQASGRINRMNTKYTDLYYYILYSGSPIDRGIMKSLKNKKDFNEKAFVKTKMWS